MQIHRFKKVDSTNGLAREYPVDSVIAADEQLEGKGRFNRNWESNCGGLWFSIVIKPLRKPCEYTFIASLAVFESVDASVEIKWPNDIVVGNKKLCGILSGVVSSGNEVEKIIIGVGVNVNNRISSELNAISLRDLLKKDVDLDELLMKILKNFERINELNLATIIRLYKRDCMTLGRIVRVKTLKGEVKGEAIDIDDEGNLLVKTEEGIMRLSEGDTTLV